MFDDNAEIEILKQCFLANRLKHLVRDTGKEGERERKRERKRERERERERESNCVCERERV